MVIFSAFLDQMFFFFSFFSCSSPLTDINFSSTVNLIIIYVTT